MCVTAAQPVIHLPFCPDNTVLVEFSGSFAQGLLSAISGRHGGDLIGLTRREVNNQNSAMKSARCSVSTTTFIHTERSYVDWIVRFVRFHGMRSREDFFPAKPKIEAFLTDRVVNGNVAPATQNQAMNALVFPTSASSILLCRAVSMPFAPTRRSTSPLSY